MTQITGYRCSMPDGINLAFITPIFKGGDKSEPKNYRPVALTKHITKAFEKIVKGEIVFHLAKIQFFDNSQHSFRSGRSTLTNLIEYYESILHLLQNYGRGCHLTETQYYSRMTWT